jgi:hypothetical protein
MHCAPKRDKWIPGSLSPEQAEMWIFKLLI